MKPEQFIREYEVEKAREVVEGAPDKTATHYVVDTGTYYSEDFLTYFDHSLEDWETADLNIIGELENIYEHVASLSDLKRLVESVEIIQFWHGIEWCKGLVEDYKEESIHKESYGHRIIQAIADYESIYGGVDA
ncbi:hypothetical protein KPE82_00390 [Acinetobacter baumannii]|uniref:hypothetical protein n=1 Tax=Acinetobacter baumannii TaxID=470 RepID=UPI001C0D7EF9|nr:hypothetical protein [Acinetobacter baumannii]MBU3094064.1 hypothetical protein [Acinetobacter baumannii]